MQKCFILGFLSFLLSCTVQAGEWQNVGAPNRMGGRMISAGYLRGKIVLLDRRDYGDVSKENRQAMQELKSIWATYKTKPFILLGSDTGDSSIKRVQAVIKKLEITYPVYQGAEFELNDSIDTNPIQIYDSTGSVQLYSGKDLHTARGILGSTILATAVPMTAKDYGQLLDYEIENLPGRAYLRLRDFRTRFPQDSLRYEEAWQRLSADKTILRLAKLVDLARLVKDRDRADATAQKLTPAILMKTIAKYEDLKQHENEFLAQEAKNAIAEITWASATLDVKGGKK